MKFYVLLLILFCANLWAKEPSLAIKQAVNDSGRSEKDQKADPLRKPDKVLSFFELEPGMQVLDVFSGGGYYSELAAKVVGPTGHVDAHNNAPYVAYIGEDKLAQRYGDNRLPNVSQLRQESNALDLEKNHYDRILLILSFHDLYHVDEKNGWNKIDDQAFMTKLKGALKPDGILGIVDHAAPAGSSSEMGNTLHRIDPQIIRQKMAEWGFELIGEADFLQNLADPLDIPMWDEKVRGRTHRVVMKYKKVND